MAKKTKKQKKLTGEVIEYVTIPLSPLSLSVAKNV